MSRLGWNISGFHTPVQSGWSKIQARTCHLWTGWGLIQSALFAPTQKQWCPPGHLPATSCCSASPPDSNLELLTNCSGPGYEILECPSPTRIYGLVRGRECEDPMFNTVKNSLQKVKENGASLKRWWWWMAVCGVSRWDLQRPEWPPLQ